MKVFGLQNNAALLAQRIAREGERIRKTITQTEQMIRRAVEPLRSVEARLAPIVDLAQAIQTQHVPAITHLQTQLESVTRTIELLKQLAPPWEQMLARLREHDKAVALLVELGWPPHEMIPSNELRRILVTYETKGVESARQALCTLMLSTFNSERIDEMVQEWSRKPWLSKRIPALQQAVEAHRRGLHFTSIPVFLAQTEGIIGEAFGHLDRLDGKAFSEYVRNLCQRPTAYDKGVERFILNVVRVQAGFGLPVRSDLSRHAIMHGIDAQYGTAPNSLKSLLLFDYIQSRIAFAAISSARSYHRLTCPAIKQPGRPRLVFMDAEEAELSGKVPCKRCQPAYRTRAT